MLCSLKNLFLVVHLIVLSELAAALTVTFYGDTQCSNTLPSTFQGVPNPLVAPLDQCTIALHVCTIGVFCMHTNCPLMFAQDGPTKLYIKPTACSSTYPHPIQSYMDSNCSKVHLDPNSYFVGACVTQGAPPGCGSFMIMCSRASVAATSVLSLAFAFIIASI